MKKIPCLLEREFYDNHSFKLLEDKITSGCEWVLNGEGIATEKMDGTACMILNGELYRRYDAKRGKQPPIGAIPCQDPDLVTGHWPHWIKVSENNPEDKWYIIAWKRLLELSERYGKIVEDGTYELCGPHFQSNPYNLDVDIFYRHGDKVLEDVPRNIQGIKKYLEEHCIEGIVFHRCNESNDMCKIRRKDFGFEWR